MHKNLTQHKHFADCRALQNDRFSDGCACGSRLQWHTTHSVSGVFSQEGISLGRFQLEHNTVQRHSASGTGAGYTLDGKTQRSHDAQRRCGNGSDTERTTGKAAPRLYHKWPVVAPSRVTLMWFVGFALNDAHRLPPTPSAVTHPPCSATGPVALRRLLEDLRCTCLASFASSSSRTALSLSLTKVSK